MATLPFEIKVIESQPFAENTYLAHLPGRDDCLVFDPGLEPELILQWLDEQRLVPAAILITHGHSDHIAGNGALKERWPECPLVISQQDEEKLTNPMKNLSAPFGISLVSPPADATVVEGDRWEAAGFSLKVLEIPGHSSGHVVFLWDEGEPQIVFGGDVLFAGSVGRTDFPDGDFDLLAGGIHQKLFTLPDSTVVFPGHGPPTDIGTEKQHNPFVGRAAGYTFE